MKKADIGLIGLAVMGENITVSDKLSFPYKIIMCYIHSLKCLLHSRKTS